MRKRNNELHVSLSDEELAIVKRMAEETGLNYRQLFIASLSDDVFLPKEYIEELKRLNDLISKFNSIVNKTGTNVNQLSKKANSTGELPTEIELRSLREEIYKIQKAGEQLYRYTRSYLQGVREPTPH